MDVYVLATRLRVPPQIHAGVRRQRLIEEMERAVTLHKLIHIAAPVGYGKTTMLAQWARESRYPVAWVSLDREDNDPWGFFRCILTAWAEVQPDVRKATLGLLLGTWMPDMQSVLRAFLNAASEVPGHTVIVLDDVHLIEEPAIHEALEYLLDRLPLMFHFVFASRGEAPLRLARYRAHNEVLDLNALDLQFLAGETSEFLNSLTDLELPQNEVERLHHGLEGWAAGLQLVALALRHPGQTPAAVEITGRHGFISDYLNEDVLAQIPDDIRRFMFQTSILETLCGPLCNALTGRTDGQEMLESLVRRNLFVVELDHQREWFRYHRLFADVLQEELRRRFPDEVAELHRRAAAWYLAHELPEQAFKHAVAGGDVDGVIQVIDRHAYVKLLGGEVATLRRWMETIPDEWRAGHPILDLPRAGLMMFAGEFDACADCIDGVERGLLQLENDDARQQLARVSALRCFVACFRNDLALAETYADMALRDLPQYDLTFRAGICGALGDTYRRNGYWEQAKQSYQRTLDFSDSPAFRFESAHVFGALADLDLRQGLLRSAAAYWRRALATCQDPQNWGKVPLPVIGWVYVRSAEIHYEWNQLEEAWTRLSHGLEHAEAGREAKSMLAGYLLATRLKMAEGDIETASGYLERARPLLDEAPVQDWISHFDRCQLELWLAQDRLRAALHWSDAMLLDDEVEQRPESEVTRLAIARVLIITGHRTSLERALATLERLQEDADSEGRSGITLEAAALQALAAWQHGDRAGAMTALERSLRLAEPEGYVRLYIDLGLPMARLLQEARSRKVMPEYVEHLLGSFGDGLHTSLPDTDLLPEPLTQRELEILDLLASGLTNREIATRLFISQQTVKKHAGNIYGKLGVRRRTEAVARARDLDILS
jgi:LuxR family transcriptional regulator, maltose regulon positive regulatory protein